MKAGKVRAIVAHAVKVQSYEAWIRRMQQMMCLVRQALYMNSNDALFLGQLRYHPHVLWQAPCDGTGVPHEGWVRDGMVDARVSQRWSCARR